MATTYYNVGRSLYKNGEYQVAEFFLGVAVDLTEAYDERSAQIKKVRSAWKECKEKLISSVMPTSLPTMRPLPIPSNAELIRGTPEYIEVHEDDDTGEDGQFSSHVSQAAPNRP